MHDHVERCLHPERTPSRKECPTLDEWFDGRFWSEWVVGRKNKPGEQYEKKSIYKLHLGPRFGKMALDEITVSEIARLRADLVAKKLGEKRINNILAVLSKALRYAVDCEVIAKSPKIGLFKIERPEVVAWDFEQYPRLLTAAKAEDEEWYAALCLAGEAGLRVGEVKELRWREDVDMIAKTITVNRQTYRGKTGTPKGRTRRTVPMTATLYEALKRMSVIREGFVVRNLDGTAKKDDQAVTVIQRICRRAGLPQHQWHMLRHTFGTHAALFGVNPWRLQTWLGHKRIDETMIYVHVAEAHARDWPEVVHEASRSEIDPDRRIIAMLGARARGKAVAKASMTDEQNLAASAG
ncbi:MAG TPA: tyrosine-type recombinase/integrase [Kofleriaceae bacterium]|jgi:integrase|nr:tyrosine-type recombinase/integrase [Kofleriaceae bacterium]